MPYAWIQSVPLFKGAGLQNIRDYHSVRARLLLSGGEWLRGMDPCLNRACTSTHPPTPTLGKDALTKQAWPKGQSFLMLSRPSTLPLKILVILTGHKSDYLKLGSGRYFLMLIVFEVRTSGERGKKKSTKKLGVLFIHFHSWSEV